METSHERLQLNAWFPMAVADYSLAHLVDNFSRDFFVESVEEETENALSPGVFPSLSLGPGQRFASKGSYVVRPVGGGLEAVGGGSCPESGSAAFLPHPVGTATYCLPGEGRSGPAP